VKRRKGGLTMREAQRDLYLAQRALGDLSALSTGRLPRRLTRRYATRALFRFLK
jgi:hypothetical protein